jgi:hypothetical protein
MGPWSTEGHARVESREGRFEGALKAVLEPPARLRAELRSGALFGMVAEQVVVALPGDGYVLFFRAREDQLERQRLAESQLGRLLPTGSPQELHALLSGRPPWPGGQAPADLSGCTRVLHTHDQGRSLEVVVEVPGGSCVMELETHEGRLQRVAWAQPGQERVEVRYGRWKTWDGMDLPGRMRLEIAGEGLRAEIDLERAESRKGFSDRDFEVY